ncbi:MAG: HD domain-containing protein [Christensenellales bacterium]|jgi:hypothetical protein
MRHQVMQSMISYFDRDIERINHAIKVHGFAQLIGKLEQLAPQQRYILEIAAIVHDIGIPAAVQKFGSAGGKYQELEGPPIAREMLTACHVDPDVIDRVVYLVGHHHSYSKIEGLDFQILVEADILVNIHEQAFQEGAIGQIKRRIFKTDAGQDLVYRLYGV